MVLEEVTFVPGGTPRFSNNLNSLIRYKMDQIVGQNGLIFIIFTPVRLGKRCYGYCNNTCF